MITLDSFDISILAILQADNTTPQRDIGERIGLSAPAVQRRIKRLRETGVIRADISVLDPEKLGRPITIFTEVKMEVEKVEIIKQAKAIFSNAPQVQQCYYVTGEVDFILILVVYSMKEYEELTQQLFFGNNNVKSFKTSIVLDIVKAGLSIPINKP
ncbi:DNA-binding Lrp family transcriptional regulator [Dyadobacter sp. BE34]|uniref:DNA-binding Lrp family transcriptional regulator n=1 Tax=Dyadobacter fermentans TaxID=94254 RepID=A0ABU1QZZ7_9BACT|nr:MULTISPECIES: Lrp/AsnC family transcriptional regulator [Dyadobacter]MDR6806693.1 DNA-binding Lrp family transcriptional regulator [Dyadobacter fermentans]MDR7044435.1 DNA-binding Lrp family transcriptional regulator [Dyadobacter sp. BE242]MDR7198745.1 DNA-binding Lrp family transcriptional regulator [Dyadobacter sp. BE34]MDR7216707.1 DNA-binding Lrp family transcriptional regulator [Dyadobacter sp. BE31]MDR7263767.1 DNA-binding Lrp family transcriptional regulator [Dyadobacter sp. BE32]